MLDFSAVLYPLVCCGAQMVPEVGRVGTVRHPRVGLAWMVNWLIKFDGFSKDIVDLVQVEDINIELMDLQEP